MQNVSPHERGQGPPDKPRNARGRAMSWLDVLLVLSAAIVLVGILLPAVNPRPAGWRMACVNNFKQLGLALAVYHDRRRCYPPAYLVDDQGQPVHSWRTLLTPYLERPDIYDCYDFSRPWDAGQPQAYLEFLICPEKPSSLWEPPRETITNYLAVVGPGTAWPGATSSKLEMFTDGATYTLLLVESSNLTPHWMAPVDLQLDSLPLAVNAMPGPSISSRHPGGAVVCFADGHVQFLVEDVSASVLSALLTIAGGETVNW